MNFIELINISKKFDRLLAVDKVNLAIVREEALGLVGESGSGKTTLARIILKLIEPSDGQIVYHGMQNIRRECQIVFQDPQTSLNPRIKIGEAIAEPIMLHQLLPKSDWIRRVE